MDFPSWKKEVEAICNNSKIPLEMVMDDPDYLHECYEDGLSPQDAFDEAIQLKKETIINNQ